MGDESALWLPTNTVGLTLSPEVSNMLTPEPHFLSQCSKENAWVKYCTQAVWEVKAQ